GTGVELLVETAGAAGIDMAAVFRFVFVAADIFLLAALAAVLLMEERPLRGPATSAPPVAPEAPPAPAEQGLSCVGPNVERAANDATWCVRCARSWAPRAKIRAPTSKRPWPRTRSTDRA